MFKSFYKIVLLFLVTLTTLFATQKDTDNLASISAVSLYNINKGALQDIIKASVKNYPNLQGLKIVESLSSETYVEFYKKDNKIIFKPIPEDLKKQYRSYKTKSMYQNEEVGFVITYFKNEGSITLSSNEQAWLQNNRILLSVDDRYAPMNFVNSQGKMDGLSIDYIKLIEKKIGYPIDLDTNSWPISLSNAMEHKSDGIINANATEERVKKLLFTKPYILAPMTLITSSGREHYSSLKELKKKIILVKEKTVESVVLPKKYPDLVFKEVKNYQSAFHLVMTQKAFGIFGHLAVLDYEMNQYMLPNLKKNFISYSEVVSAQAIGVRNSAPLLQDILNKAISSISDKEKKRINNKWMGTVEENKKELTYKEVKWIKQNPTIRIAVVDNYAPYDFRNERNKLVGFHSDLAQLMNNNLGINIILRPFPSWTDAFNAATSGSVHGIFSLSWSKEREEKYFNYSNPYHFSPYYLVVNEENKQNLTLENFGNKSIAVEKDTIFEKIIRTKAPQVKIVFVKDTKEAYESVKSGKVVGTISPNIKDNLFKKSGLRVTSELFDKSSNLHIGTHKKFPLIASILNKGIDSVSLKQLSSLRQKWLTKSKATIELNAKEKAWIQKNPTVKMIEFFDEPPFTLNGTKKSGYVYEMLEYLIKSAGLEVEYVSGYNSYGDMLTSIENGSADILSTYPTSLDLGPESKLVKSKSVLKTPFVLIGKTNENAIRSIQDLFGKRVAVVKGYVQDKYLSKFPQIKKVYVNNNDEGFTVIRQKKADYYINNRANTEFILNKSFLTDLHIVYELPYDKFPPLSISFAMNGQKKTMVSILNKALEQISFKTIKKIRDKWILQTDASTKKKIVFSESEKAWLLKNSSVRLAYMDYWPVDDNGDNIHTEYIGLLSKYGNINVTLVKYDAWKKGFADTVKGNNAFGILNLSWSKEREEKSFDYTKPYFFTPGYLIVKKKNTTIKSVEDLANKTIFVKDKAITNQIIKELKYNITPINLKNEEMMYKQLGQDGSKAEALLTYVYDPELLDKYDLKVANKFFSKFGEVHIGVSKNQKELFSILNKIYSVIPKSELSRIQNKVYKKTKRIKVELTKKEKAFIKSHPTIKVHNEKNWPPFNFYEFGQPKGYSVELMKLVAKNTGLNIEFVTGPTWDEFLQMMKKDELDVVINIVKNEERSEYMLFTDPFIQATMGIAVHSDRDDIKTFDEMLSKKVALENGFFYHDYFKKNHPDTKLVVVDNGVQTLQSVVFKKADATIGFVPVMKYIAEKNFITRLDYFTDMSSPIMKPMPLRFSTRKNSPELLSILQKGLASIDPTQQKKLNNRWLGRIDENKIVLKLSKEEKKWLNEHKQIKFTADPSYLPYEAFDSDGNYIGIVADYLDIIENTLDITFKKIPTKNWTESLEMSKNGKIDVLSNYTVDEELKDIHTSTKPYIVSPISIVMRDDTKVATTLENLKNKTIAVVKGYGYLDKIFAKYPHLNYIEVNNAREGLIGVSIGKYDAIICSLTLAQYTISDLGLHNLRVAGQTGETMQLGLGIRKDWDILVRLINRVVDSISQGTRQEINKNWLGENFEAAKRVNLTKKEQVWVDKKIPIKYVFDPDWAPFEWKNELGEHTGIVYDILNIVRERTGLIFEPVATNNWTDAVKLAETKQVDMYGGLGENEDRKKYMNFTENTLYKTPYVFVVHKDHKDDHFDTFKSLKGNERIAVVDGYTIQGIMKDKQPNIKLQTVPSTMEGFRQVTNKNIDIFLVNASTAKYYINRKGFENLKIATKTEYKLEIKTAIRDDWPLEVISILDKALESISEKELSDVYLKWTEVLVEEKIDWDLIYRIAGGALVVLLLVAYWNRKLKKAVDSKTIELKKLLDSFDENVIASKTDVKGTILYASKAFCEISGYTQKELIGSPQSIVRHPEMPKSVFKDLWQTIQSGKVWKGEVKNKTKNGGFYWVEVVITPEFDEQGTITGYSAIRQDISSKKEVEELSENLEIKVKERTLELQEAQEQFSSMAANVPGVIYRCKVDAGWTMLYISNEIEVLSGYPVSEFINNKVRTFADIMHEDDIEPVATLIQNQIDKGEKFLVDYRVIDNNGVVKWVRSQGQAYMTDNNEQYLDGVLFDVTEQKKLEEEVKESQKRFATIFDAAPDSISLIKDGEYISCNQKTLEIFGVDCEDTFKQSKPSDFSPEMQECGTSSAQLAPEKIQEAIETGYNRFEWIHKRIDTNESFDAEVILSSIDLGGEAHIYAVVRDISERKELERVIKENTEQMTYVSQHANLGFWNFNPQIGDLFVNDVFVEMLGYDSEEVLLTGYENKMFKPFKDGLAFWEQLLHPDDAKRTGEIITAHINGETDLYNVEYRMRRADGTWMWSRAVGRISKFDEDGKPIRFNGVNIDIDEAKRAQELIADQKQYTDSIMNSQSNIVISTDGEKLRTANKSFLDFFEVKDEQEFLDNIGDCICDTFDTELPDEFLQKMMGDEKWIEYVYARPDIIHKARIERHGQMHIFTITSDRFEFAGEMLEVAVFTDITEIEDIRRNIETILSNIMLPVLITAKESRTILYANEYASIQYEAPIDRLVGSNIDSVYTSLDQKEKILSIMSEQGYVENLEERYRTQTGKEFIGLLSVKPIVYNGEEAFIGMVVDITQQKEIEDEIRRIHKHTQSSIEYASLIQHSLIPSNDLFRKYYDDYFTIWHPKDIVGGDIYLFDELRNDNECLLMVIDCTGHGVPGAFVTMLVKAIERQVAAIIASDENLEVSPAWILQYFNQTMKTLLKQEDDDAISNAGFDGAVLYYNRRDQIVRFAGAELPLFYIENGEMKTIKGNRHSIGYKKSDATYEFKEHLIEAKEGMQFYLTSDGYLDQNGGEKGFPFGKKRFQNILMEYKDYSFADQQEVLLNELQAYQQKEERNDDISIVGVKIGKLDATKKTENESWVI